MPRLVWLLGFAILVQGTSELMVAGLLPEIAADLTVSLTDAALLISGFAVGMLVGAPVLAVLTRRLPPRATLLGLLGVFALAHVAGALAPGYTTLLAGRVVAAVVYAGFWAVASATAVGAVGEAVRGRAMSVVVGGLTVSVLVGLPAGTALGQALGWRAAFWAVALATALTAIAVARVVPRTSASPASPASPPSAASPTGGRSLRSELATLATAPVLLAWSTIAVATAALLAVYSYLSPVVTDGAGLAPAWVPVLLAVYGVGAVAGIVVGGRGADRAPLRTIGWGLAALVVVSATLAWSAPTVVTTVALIALLGFAGFVTNPAMQLRVLTLTDASRDLAAGGSVSAFNIGIAVGPWLGGLVLAGTGRPHEVGWVGAALGVLALVTVLPMARVGSGVNRRSAALEEAPSC